MKWELFQKQIAYLGIFYNKNLDEDQARVYWRFLKHLSDEKFDFACKNIIQNFVPTSTVPFPLPPHFLQNCGEAGDTKSITAISILKRTIRKVGPYHSVLFKDAALNYAVNSFGGWIAVCNWNDKDWDINEQRLINTYKAALISGYNDVSHLSGIAEIEPNGFFKLHYIKKDGDTFMSKEYTAETLAIDLAKIQKKIANSTPKQVKQIDDIIDGCLPGKVE